MIVQHGCDCDVSSVACNAKGSHCTVSHLTDLAVFVFRF